MSWNPFRPPPLKKTAISRTAEREFEREQKKLEQLHEDAKKIHKDTKRCIEEQTNLCKSECRIGHELLSSALCREDDQLRPVADAIYQVQQKLDSSTQELTDTENKVMVEPIKKLCAVFPAIQAEIKQREHLLQEYTKCLSRVEKYQDKGRTGAVIVKLESNKKALSKSKEEYDAVNGPLMEDMPKLYDGRIEYFQPSFQALIKAQVRYYTEAHKHYTELARKLQGPEEQSTELMRQKIQHKLAEIKALSLTADD